MNYQFYICEFKKHKTQSKLKSSHWWHFLVTCLCLYLAIFYQVFFIPVRCHVCGCFFFFFKPKARSEGIIYSIKNQSVFYLPWQLMSRQMKSFLILSVTIFTVCFSWINDEDRCDWCCQCLWTKVDVVLAADFNVWLLFFIFDRKVSVICIEELTDRYFIFNETWVILRKVFSYSNTTWFFNCHSISTVLFFSTFFFQVRQNICLMSGGF